MSAGAEQHARLERATADLDAPFAVVDLDAFDRNRADLARRAGGVPIRLASKSVRCRALQRRVLDGPDGAFRGVLALTLPEALWLQDEGFEDLVVAYPTVDRGALRELAARAAAGRPPITVMVDDVAHLDAIAAAGARA
ncbi:amino acid deaminase/aldolase, partial [Patulibacter sp. S7RM1-6]